MCGARCEVHVVVERWTTSVGVSLHAGQRMATRADCPSLLLAARQKQVGPRPRLAAPQEGVQTNYGVLRRRVSESPVVRVVTGVGHSNPDTRQAALVPAGSKSHSAGRAGRGLVECGVAIAVHQLHACHRSVCIHEPVYRAYAAARSGGHAGSEARQQRLNRGGVEDCKSGRNCVDVKVTWSVRKRPSCRKENSKDGNHCASDDGPHRPSKPAFGRSSHVALRKEPRKSGTLPTFLASVNLGRECTVTCGF